MGCNFLKTPPGLILFDVYDTILSMDDIERRVNSILDSKRAYTLWFELLMQYICLDNCTGRFHSFRDIAEATLQMTAGTLDKKTGPEQVKAVLRLMEYLPVKEGVPDVLSGLRDEHYRLAALTNASSGIVRERMQKSGLISYFEEVLSAEHIKVYKPAKKAYHWAVQKFELTPAEILFVSSHSWDIAGAQNAGMQTAFIPKRKESLYALLPPADITCNSLSDLYEALREIRHSS